MRTRIAICLSAALLIAGAVITVWGDVPTSMNVQGQLTDSAGNPVAPGSKTFCFAIFDAPTNGTKIWPPAADCEQKSVEIKAAGLWNAQVGGAEIALTPEVFQDTARWLQIKVDAETLSRIKLNTNPFSYRAASSQDADTAEFAFSIANDSVSTPKIASNAVTTSKIANETILFEDIGTNGATSGQVIKRSNVNTWVAGYDSTGGWYDQGTVVRLGTSTDNVGIGTTSPNAKLDVNGSISFYFDYNSGWFWLAAGSETTLTHGLNVPPDSLVVILDGKNGCGIHQANYGTNPFAGGSTKWFGCEWDRLTTSTISVTRAADDNDPTVPSCKKWDSIRVRIIKRQ